MLAYGRQNQDSRILADKPIPTARREGHTAFGRIPGMGFGQDIYLGKPTVGQEEFCKKIGRYDVATFIIRRLRRKKIKIGVVRASSTGERSAQLSCDCEV